MSHQLESALEKESVSQLIAQGINTVDIHNDAAMLVNLKQHIERINHLILSDVEFSRLVTMITQGDIYDASRRLRDKFVFALDNGIQHYLVFISPVGSENALEVTTQYWRHDNRWRFDAVIFLNGLPLINLELKQRGTSLQKAFDQIDNYRQKLAYNGLFKFLQILIISNGVNTRYFANSDSKFVYSNTFNWADDKNRAINNLTEFISIFLTPKNLLQMISFYMNVPEKTTTSSPRLTVLRPYQVHALKASHKALEANKSGYIWHATGSGKTLTSFQLSQREAASGKYRVVIFLVDRKDLDSQTFEEFERYQPGSIKSTQSTYELVESLKKADGRPIITTIQKFSRLAALLEDPAHPLNAFVDEKVLFVIDECHRSQFGDMHKKMKKVFPKAQYIGFTGTPILPENANNGRTTADVFGDCLHIYSMSDSINDKNTLPFLVSYARTVENVPTFMDNNLVQSIDTQEILHSPERISKISRDVFASRDRNSGPNHEFTGILTVDRVSTAQLYYAEFAKINAERDAVNAINPSNRTSYKVSAVFSTSDSDENGPDTISDSVAFMGNVIADYNTQFGTGYSVDNPDAYVVDARNRFKRSEINIMIVVRMLLTGYDSEWINGLYVDRKMQAHELIQAMSRTNRVLRNAHNLSKPAGQVRFYQTTKDDVDTALRIFANTDTASNVLAPNYQDSLARLREAVTVLKTIVPTIASVDLPGDEHKKNFVDAFIELNRAKVAIQPYLEFDFDKIVGNFDDSIKMTDQDFYDYRSKYLDLAATAVQGTGVKVSVLNQINFHLEELSSNMINVDYITALLKDLNRNDPAAVANVVEVNKQLAESQDEKLRLTGELIKTFIDSLPNVPDNVTIPSAFANHISMSINHVIEQSVVGISMTEVDLAYFVSEFAKTGRIEIGSLIKKIGCKLKDPDRAKKIEAAKKNIKTIANMYKVY